MKRADIIYLISFLTIVTIIGINKLTSGNCPQIVVFKDDSLYSVIKFFGNVIFGIGIWIIGFQVAKKLSLKRPYVLAYFIILSLASVNGLIKEIWRNNFGEHKELTNSICNKSRDDGMTYKANKLTADEYNYLAIGSSWLPVSPKRAKNIEISYYRDAFLGNYSLNIEIEMPPNERIDTSKFPKWQQIEKNKYEFLKHQN